MAYRDYACRCEKIYFAYTKKYKGVRLNPLKMWPYIFLFYFSEFLMRIDFCWCAAHFNSASEFGSSAWESIEMQREARSVSRIPLPEFTGDEVELTTELPVESRLEIEGRCFHSLKH